MDRKITMLGTGHALVTKCYNTCFTITNGGNIFLVDAGGGNGILSQAEKAGIDFADIHQMFLTHAHTDHIIGVVWVVRKVVTMIEENKYHGSLDIYCHNEAASALTTICGALLAKKQLAHIGKDIFIRTVADGDTLSTGGMTLTFFDIKSTKLKQYGFRAVWDNGLALVCPGDEPLCEENYRYAQGADWLMHEAFCLASQADVFRPYENHHSAA